MDTASKLNNTTHFLSFSRKLFLSVISLFLVFAGCFLAYQYQREKEYKIDLLDIQPVSYTHLTVADRHCYGRRQQELQCRTQSMGKRYDGHETECRYSHLSGCQLHPAPHLRKGVAL